MFNLNNLCGFGAEGQHATFSYVGTTGSTSDLTTYTFAAHALGDTHPGRYTIVGVTADSATLGGGAVNSVTVGGIAGTELVEQTSGNGGCSSLYIVDTKSLGTTADIVVTFNQGLQNARVHVWRATGINPVPTATYTDASGDPSTFNMVIPAASCAVALVTVDTATGSIVWTGLTERSDAAVETSVQSCADGLFNVPNASLTVSADHSGNQTSHQLVGAVFVAAGGLTIREA